MHLLRVRSLCLALLASLALPACGLKGPLYLPGSNQPPAADTQPAATQKK